MNLTLASMFRDSIRYLPRYFAQVEKFRAEHDVRLVIAEGDSIDGTYTELATYMEPGDLLLKVDHGGRKYGSIDHPDRWGDIARVFREIAAQVGDPGDAFVWVESDLEWSVETLCGLLRDLDKVEAVAPQVRAIDPPGTTERFYDVWGFRIDGTLFTPYHPYWPPTTPVDSLIKIDSCGSCFVTSNMDLVHAWDGVWPFPADGKLWMDPNLRIFHS
jgi:hypothetical protein